MNIILIQTDQQRMDSLACYGNTLTNTPALDKLAERGTVFENCFTPTPVCAPARGSLLCGRFPSRHGILRNPESGIPAGYDFNADYKTYSQCLIEKNYQCHHIGKWHIGDKTKPKDFGFEGVFYPKYGFPEAHPHYLNYLKELGLDGFELESKFYATFKDGSKGPLLSAIQNGGVEASVPWYLGNQTLDAIKKCASSKDPFFVSCNFWGPHVPYIIPEEYNDINPENIPEPESFNDDLKNKPVVQQQMKEYWGVQDLTWEDWSKLKAGNYGYVNLIDRQVERILRLLDELKIEDDTAIIFTTDHGGMVGSHGLCDKGPYMYDDICRVPLITYIPGQKEQQRIAANVYTMDLMPTFIDLGKGETPDDLDALSIMPLLEGSKEFLREGPVYMEFYGHQIGVTQKVLRTKDWKYIFNGQDIDEYYDLKNDPHEIINEFTNPDYKTQINQAISMLGVKLRELKDPVFRYFLHTRIH